MSSRVDGRMEGYEQQQGKQGTISLSFDDPVESPEGSLLNLNQM